MTQVADAIRPSVVETHPSDCSRGPVTVIVKRRVKPGREKQYEEWLKGITHEVSSFEGHMGTNVIRPAENMPSEYVVIFRFNCYENLQRWEHSEVRQTWIAHARDFTEGEPQRQQITGLEYWFTPPAGVGVPNPPPRYKMVFLTILAIYPLLLVVPFLLGMLIEYIIGWMGIPQPIQTLLNVVVLVSLMTYVVMPRMTRWFAHWLYPPSKQV